MSHQYVVSEQVEELEKWTAESGHKLPLLRDVDSSYYLRQEKHGFNFEGFGDWDADTVSKKTGLCHEDAINSMDRIMTEPIEWIDTIENYKVFINYYHEFKRLY